MGYKQYLVLLLTFCSLTSFAQQMPPPATKPPMAKFSLQLPLLRLTSNSAKTDSATGESKNDSFTETTTLVQDETYIGIDLGKINIYVYPFADGNHFVSGGYMLSETIEIGADLGLNSGKNTESTLIGGWGTYYMTFGSIGLESGLNISLISRKNEVAPDTTAKSSETSIKATSLATYPLMRNLKYIGGVFLRNSSSEVDGGDKSSNFQFGIILAGLRMRWL